MKKITAAPGVEYWSLLCPVTAVLFFQTGIVFMVIAFIVIAFIVLLHRPLYQAHHTNLHQQYHRYTNCKSGFSGFVVKKSHAKDRPDAATDDST